MEDLGFLGLDPTMLANMVTLDERKALAQQLMGTAMPQGMNVGGTYVAPNPLQFLNSAIRQGAGAYKNNKLIDEEASSSKAYIDALIRHLRGPQGPGAPAQMPQGLMNSE